jgi:beta-1,4-mannosyltransferase
MQKKTNSIQSLFLPTSDNPYQNLLARNLKNYGVEVRLKKRKRTYIFLPSIVREKIEILHLHWLSPFFLGEIFPVALFKVLTFWSQLIFLKLSGKKILWTAHNLSDHENSFPILDHLCTNFVAQIAHSIITHCETAKNKIILEFGIKNKDKIIVIPHGNFIDSYENKIKRDQARQQLGIHGSNIVFLLLGTIRPYKGVVESITAFQKIKEENVQLIIVGTPHSKNYSETINQKIGDDTRVSFTPSFVPEKKIQLYMNACDVAVFPYKDILTSGAVILAMSFGKVCLAPQIGCIPETLDDSGAFLYDPSDEEGLQKSMNKAIMCKSELGRMGDYNRQKAEQWNWDKIAKMTADAYKTCLDVKH